MSLNPETNMAPGLKDYKSIGLRNRMCFWEATIFQGKFLNSTATCGKQVYVTLEEEESAKKKLPKSELLKIFKRYLNTIEKEWHMYVLNFNDVKTIENEKVEELRQRLEEREPFIQSYFDTLDALAALHHKHRAAGRARHSRVQ